MAGLLRGGRFGIELLEMASDANRKWQRSATRVS